MPEELRKKLKKVFEKTQKEIEFSSSFEELNSNFYIENRVLDCGYVSSDFSQQLCGIIMEALGNFINQFHEFLMPNTQSMIRASESKIITVKEREDFFNLIKKIMVLIRKNHVADLTKEAKLRKDIIDEANTLYKEELKPKTINVFKKLQEEWEKE